jgi:hypothetical protein
MSLKIFSQAPYYDDYDEDKKYLRMLFRPGVSLQVRELNQLQTYLQSQIERLGLHLFKEGAMVVPGQTAIDTKIIYLKIEAETNGVEISTILDQLVGKSLTNDAGVAAQVITYVAQEDTDPITLMVRYTSSSDTNTATKVFALNELLSTTIDSEQVFVQIQSAGDSIGVGSIASIQRGIYFVKSQFAMVDESIIVLDKYSNTPSYRVGLTINENIVTSNTDATLNDNSNGTPNENAPGAHRYQLNLVLSKLTLDSVLDENFLELLRVDAGQLQSQVITTNYNELAKTLARRTYDESGNYTVRAFKMALREHRNNNRGAWHSFTSYRYGDIVTSGGNSFVCVTNNSSGQLSGGVDPSVNFSATNPYQVVSDGNVSWNYTDRPPYNRGLYTPENGGDNTKFAVAIEPGKAYVQGYEVEKIATEFLPVDKSQTYDRIDSDSVDIKYGNYIFVKNLHGLPDCSTYPTIALFNQLSPASSIQTAGSGTQVGTARIRALEYYSGTPGIGAIYKAYLFDVTMSSGYVFDRDVKQLFYSSGTTLYNITADVCSVYPTLTGTISASTTTITGVGTKFLTQLKVGDYIYVENSVGGFESARVATITSNTVLSITAAFSGTVTGKAFARHQTAVQDPSYTALLFPLAYSFIRKVKGGTADNVFSTSYTTTQRFDGSTTSGQTSLTISIGSPTGATTLGTEFNPAASVNAYVVINRSTGLPVSPSSVTLSNAGATAVFAGLTQSQSYSVFAPVRKSGSIAQQKSKTLVLNSVVDFTTAATVAPVKLSLGKSDGYRLVKVLMKNSGYTASSDPSTTTDITDWYTFDDGQTETHYDLATITRKDGYPVPKGAVRVIFDYFSHTVGNAGDYFSVDSYAMPYEKIPYFVYTGGSMALADVLDFRPRINDAGTAYSSTGASQSELPKLGFETIASYSYYLSRRDKIALDIDGKFYTIPGVPSLTPQEPKDPELGMLLAKANMSPYTLYPDKGSVIVETVDNKRYTMRDIGKLDKRIENLEYYTALSLLESDTKSLSIQDDAGLERFKNGFIVDNFKGQSLGDIGSVEYRCSIDMTNQELRPFYTMDNVNLVEKNQVDTDRTGDGYQLTGDIITLPYNSVEFIKQPFASRTENVNPFAVFTFLGTMALNPPSDDWFETDRRPDVVSNVEGNFSAVLSATEKSGALGTVWGAWETTWTGASRNIDRMVVTSGFDKTDYGLGAGKWSDRHTFTSAELAAIGGDAVNYGQDGVGKRVLTYQTTATTIGQSRTGITTSVTPKTDYEVVDDKVLNTSIIPYIRAREVLFVCQGLKPNTKVNAYFDGTAIGSYITPATKIAVVQNGSIEFDTTTNAGAASSDVGRQYNGAPSTAYNKGDVVYVKTRSGTTYNSQITSPARAVVVAVEKATDTGAEAIYVMNVYGTFTAGDVLQGSLSGASYICSNTVTTASKGGDLVTNFNGTLAGVFSIPNGDGARFRTGIREFKLTDSPTNGLDYTTQGRGQYRAQGVIETKQRSINAVRNAEVVTKPASESRTDEIFSSERLIRDTGWYDPLAQTFMVNSKGGAFITGVDVFFATKDPNIPVHCQVRESVNGYPGTGILPFSKVALTPDKVNTTADGINPDPGSDSLATRFTFESPIYVNDQTEYCFVLLSDSNQYRVWISQLGEKNVGTDRFISDQPYAGVLFKSQNASTWTANQEQDLKFTMYRAQFVTNTTGTVTFNNDVLPPARLERDPFKTTYGSAKVRVKHNNHGMPTGSSVLITNVAAATYNGIVTTTNTGLNGTFTISNPESDSYVITVSTNATATGYVGGTDIIATENVPMDAMSFMTQSQTFSDTALRYSALVTDTSYTVGSAESDEYDVIPNQTLYFDKSQLVASQTNENGATLGGQKSLKVKARMSTTNDAVSPVIDTSRLSVATIKNRIDNFTHLTKNVSGLDDITIIDAGAGVTFDSGNPTVISIPSSSRGAVKGIAVGKYISISSTSTNDTASPVRVTAIASDGSTITTNGSFSTQSPSTCTITLKDNYVSEHAPIGGSATSKYLTRLINLENPSTHLTILFAANIPPVTDSDIQVWYKLIPTGTNGDISLYPFVLATSPNKPVVKSSSSSEFRDIQYELSDLPAFDAVVVKLVFKSANSAQTPRVKDLRIIACA